MDRVARAHADWRKLVEPSEPFVTVPVLKRVFPDGLPPANTETRAQVRARLADLSLNDRARRTRWFEWVLGDLLAHGPRLRHGPAISGTLEHVAAEHGAVLRPDYAVLGPAVPGDTSTKDHPRLLVRTVEHGTPIRERLGGDRWAASHLERARLLCRSVGCELGIVTDGEQWVLLWAPRGQTGGHATFTASLFSEEPALLDSFVALLGARRLFSVKKGDHLEALFEESASAEEEVTNQLGSQVRAATELLVAALSRANRESRDELLGRIDPQEVYNAALTVMMRLVFLLAAEERGLLPLGDDYYNRAYAISTIREQLRSDADQLGEEALEHRRAAWHRILATTRAVHGGISHEDLRIPGYGGGLFDPDRYPFLEGRRTTEGWREELASPVPIDDRTVLDILTRLQVLTFRVGGVTEARTLSYRSLGVEQIGHVYEGLLDHSAVRVDDVAVGLIGRTGIEPEVPLIELEAASARGRDAYVSHVVDLTEKSEGQITRLLELEPDEDRERLLRVAAENNQTTYERLRPHVMLLREDARGLPTVFPPGSIYVTESSARRETGTAYTSRELADEVVKYALEPLVYDPGPADSPDPSDWKLKSSDEILALKICDPAVGSGAIIVAACRYLADRLVEAWTAEREEGLEPSLAGESIWTDSPQDLSLTAQRAVADRCVHGVDRNPMAIEMAKLSMWLVTMAKEKPFTFLDHAFKVGDSLLGITDLAQIASLHPNPERGRRIHSQRDLFRLHFEDGLRPLLEEAQELRRQLKVMPLITVRDSRRKASLNRRADQALTDLRLVGDVVTAAAISTSDGTPKQLDDRLLAIAPSVVNALDPNSVLEDRMRERAQLRSQVERWLEEDRSERGPTQEPVHWPVAFPEVFFDTGRFDVAVSNPPFLSGHDISGVLGRRYREYLKEHVAGRSGAADVVAYFALRMAMIADTLGFLATNSITQGRSMKVSLEPLVDEQGWTIFRGVRRTPWPGSQGVNISKIWMTRRSWEGQVVLEDEAVQSIEPTLLPGAAVGSPERLRKNSGLAFQGYQVIANNLIIDAHMREEFIRADPSCESLFRRFVNGITLNGGPPYHGSKWVIDFGTRSEAEARQFTNLFEYVQNEVRPEVRAKGKSYDRWRARWWQFWSPRPALRKAIARLDRVVVMARTSKVMQSIFLPSDWCHTDALVVFAFDDEAALAILNSSLHWWWAVATPGTGGSSLKTDPRYTTSTAFETFPRPPVTEALRGAGKRLDEARQKAMSSMGIGLTELYDLLGMATEDGDDIAAVRAAHVAVDKTVIEALAECDDGHEWASLNLAHGFHDTPVGVRWTISKAARSLAVPWLIELNIDRWEGGG